MSNETTTQTAEDNPQLLNEDWKYWYSKSNGEAVKRYKAETDAAFCRRGFRQYQWLCVALMFIIGVLSTAVLVPVLSQKRTETISTNVPIPMEYHSANHLLSSICFFGSSGTVISKGPQVSAVIGCAHAIVDRNGNWSKDTYRAGNVKGKVFDATLIAVDTKADLSLWTIPSEYALAYANVPDILPETEYSMQMIGWPEGKGPNLKRIAAKGVSLRTVENVNYPNNDVTRWYCKVASGQAWGGDSGGGIFIIGGAEDPQQEGMLVSVISSQPTDNNNNAIASVRDNHWTAPGLFGPPHSDVLAFVQKNLPTNCRNGICRAKRRQQTNTPQNNNGERKAPTPWLDPNVKIPLLEDNQEAPPPDQSNSDSGSDSKSKLYSGDPKHPYPEYLNRIYKRVIELDKLEHTVAIQERIIASLQKEMEKINNGAPIAPLDTQSIVNEVIAKIPSGKTGPAGPAGPTGPSGPAGSLGGPGPAGPAGPTGSAGKDGLAGKDGTEGPAGLAGPQGKQGVPGVVTVNFIDDATGKIIQTASNLESGSTVNFRKKHFPLASTSAGQSQK